MKRSSQQQQQMCPTCGLVQIREYTFAAVAFGKALGVGNRKMVCALIALHCKTHCIFSLTLLCISFDISYLANRRTTMFTRESASSAIRSWRRSWSWVSHPISLIGCRGIKGKTSAEIIQTGLRSIRGAIMPPMKGYFQSNPNTQKLIIDLNLALLYLEGNKVKEAKAKKRKCH